MKFFNIICFSLLFIMTPLRSMNLALSGFKQADQIAQGLLVRNDPNLWVTGAVIASILGVGAIRLVASPSRKKQSVEPVRVDFTNLNDAELADTRGTMNDGLFLYQGEIKQEKGTEETQLGVGSNVEQQGNEEKIEKQIKAKIDNNKDWRHVWGLVMQELATHHRAINHWQNKHLQRIFAGWKTYKKDEDVQQSVARKLSFSEADDASQDGISAVGPVDGWKTDEEVMTARSEGSPGFRKKTSKKSREASRGAGTSTPNLRPPLTQEELEQILKDIKDRKKIKPDERIEYLKKLACDRDENKKRRDDRWFYIAGYSNNELTPEGALILDCAYKLWRKIGVNPLWKQGTKIRAILEQDDQLSKLMNALNDKSTLGSGGCTEEYQAILQYLRNHAEYWQETYRYKLRPEPATV